MSFQFRFQARHFFQYNLVVSLRFSLVAYSAYLSVSWNTRYWCLLSLSKCELEHTIIGVYSACLRVRGYAAG